MPTNIENLPRQRVLLDVNTGTDDTGALWCAEVVMGDDGLRHTGVVAPDHAVMHDEPAAEAIARIANEAPGLVTLVALSGAVGAWDVGLCLDADRFRRGVGEWLQGSA